MWNPSDILTFAEAPAVGFTATVAPYLPVLGLALAGILAGIFATYNRKRGNVETRAPDVNEIWQQQAEQSAQLDLERKQRRRLEDYSRDVLRAFRSYFYRVHSGGTIEPTQQEHRLLDSEPPTMETVVIPHHS